MTASTGNIKMVLRGIAWYKIIRLTSSAEYISVLKPVRSPLMVVPNPLGVPK
jgi:hypothetical protein